MRLIRFFKDVSLLVLWKRHLRPTTLRLGNLCNLRGVEIGTQCGFNAFGMLKYLDISKLWLVDPYTVYMDGLTIRQSRPIYMARRNLRNYKNKIEFMVMTSEEAASILPDDLDFVYIDGNHDLIKEDIALYYPKVKVGGMLGGHDFKGNYIKIIKEVMAFAERNHLELHTKKLDWWVIKK